MQRTTFFHSCLGVFQGGGCRAAALVGAYCEAINRGVQFVEVAGTSAGSIIAALVGAGATPEQLNDFIHELDFRRFLSPPEIAAQPAWYLRLATRPLGGIADIVFHQGLHSSAEIGNWVETCLRKLLGNQQGPILFSQLPYPTSIVATDITSRRPKVWNTRLNRDDSVSLAVRASCSIPVFFQPVNRQFVDGGALSNLPAFVFANSAIDRPLTSRILAFELVGDDDQIKKWGTLPFLTAIANTVVDGAQHVQMELQPNVHSVRIPTGAIKATDFAKVDSSALKQLIRAGHEAVAKYLDNELVHIRATQALSPICRDREELYNRLTMNLGQDVRDVTISEFDTDFVYQVFPTLFLWRLRGARLRVLLNSSESKREHGAYRRRLLRRLGAEVVEIDSTPLRGYFINCSEPIRGSAYIVAPTTRDSDFGASVYEGAPHQDAIAALYGRVSSAFPANPTPSPSPVPDMVAGSHDLLLGRLKTVPQYSKPGVTLSVERIRLNDLLALANYVHEYKYRQFQHWILEFQKRNLGLFAPANAVLSDNVRSIITPPVVEASGDKYVLIEGSTRAVFLRDHGEAEITCVVVRGSQDALPGKSCSFSHVRVVARRVDTDIRYENFRYDLFRQIELAAHPLEDLA